MLEKKWDKNCWYTVDLSTSIYYTVFQFVLHTKKGPHQEIPSFCEKTAKQTCKLGLACLKIREQLCNLVRVCLVMCIQMLHRIVYDILIEGFVGNGRIVNK